jgi:hypothetical protein
MKSDVLRHIGLEALVVENITHENYMESAAAIGPRHGAS